MRGARSVDRVAGQNGPYPLAGQFPARTIISLFVCCNNLPTPSGPNLPVDAPPVLLATALQDTRPSWVTGHTGTAPTKPGSCGCPSCPGALLLQSHPFHHSPSRLRGCPAAGAPSCPGTAAGGPKHGADAGSSGDSQSLSPCPRAPMAAGGAAARGCSIVRGALGPAGPVRALQPSLPSSVPPGPWGAHPVPSHGVSGGPGDRELHWCCARVDPNAWKLFPETPGNRLHPKPVLPALQPCGKQLQPQAGGNAEPLATLRNSPNVLFCPVATGAARCRQRQGRSH